MATEQKKEEPKTALNIVLLPDKITFNKVFVMSSRLARNFDTEFVINNSNFRPHITIYQGYYPDRNQEALFDALRKLKPDKINVKMGGFQSSLGTFIFWECVRTPELQEFHEAVLEAANPLREGNIPPVSIDLLPSLSPEKREMVETTGGILNRELFHPHITLTRLKNPSDADEAVRFLGSQERADSEPYYLVSPT